MIFLEETVSPIKAFLISDSYQFPILQPGHRLCRDRDRRERDQFSGSNPIYIINMGICIYYCLKAIRPAFPIDIPQKLNNRDTRRYLQPSEIVRNLQIGSGFCG